MTQTHTPKCTTYVDKRSQRWHVRIRFSGSDISYRPALGLPADEDPTERFEMFQAQVLPSYIEQFKEAQAAQAQAEHKSRHTQPGNTLQQIADWYLDTHLPFLKRGKKTIGNYRATIHGFIAFCSTKNIARAQQLSTRIIQEWQMQLANSRAEGEASRYQVLAIKRWLQHAYNAGELKKLPDLQWVVPPKTKSKRFKALPRQTIDRWIDGLIIFRPFAGHVAQWVDSTGWRISDVLDLRIGEINFDPAHVDGPHIDRLQIKTKSGLNYPLNPKLESYLRAALEFHDDPTDDAVVFLNHNRQPWDYHALAKVVEWYRKNHFDGPHITFRDLRKSFGSRMAMNGCPVNILQELMGHADINMTLEYYVDVDLNRMRQWSQWHTETATDYGNTPNDKAPANGKSTNH